MILLDNVTITRGHTSVASQLRLEIGPGEAVAMIGRSAAGKTALVETIAGLLAPQSGRVELAAAAGQEALRVGYAPADSAAWPVMRADEFLEMAGLAAGLVGKSLRLAVARGLGFADCDLLRDRRLDSLSDGQRKRLLVAATLLHDPDLLVLDDPMRGLDIAGRTDVEQVVADLTLAGGSVVAALNDAQIGPCWTRVLLLVDGSILDTGNRHQQTTDGWPVWSLEPLAALRLAIAQG